MNVYKMKHSFVLDNHGSIANAPLPRLLGQFSFFYCPGLYSMDCGRE